MCAEERRPERRFPARLLSGSLGALLLFAALVGCLLYLTGAATGGVFTYLGLAAACVVVSSLAWEVVVRQAPRRPARPGDGDRALEERKDDEVTDLEEDPPGAAVWIAFPIAISFGLASLPFLVLVVYPPAEEYFTEPGRVTASIIRTQEGLTLSLGFPEPTTERGENLRINGRPLPESYVRDHPDSLVWRSPQTVWLRIEPLLRELGLERIERIGINQLPGVERFTYRTGLTVPQQRAVVTQPP